MNLIKNARLLRWVTHSRAPLSIARVLSHEFQVCSMKFLSTLSSDVKSQFENAKQRLGTLKESPDNTTKLKLYALFKQANVGKCNASKPTMFDMVGKAKWDAWNSLGNMGQDEAAKKYVNIVDELVGKEEVPVTVQQTSSGGYETIIFSKRNGIATIMLNRPKKKNAISLKMYEEINQSLKDAAEDPKIVFAAITGAGDYYCSGNDLSNLTSFSGDIDKAAREGAEFLKVYVNSYIDFPKPLVALVNGPAVGIAVTVLGLFDLVYASDSATFHTPFSALGQSPEGCSSYIFPMLMGPAKANELLMLGRLINASEAKECGLVTEVFPAHSFHKETALRLEKMSKLPAKSILIAKQLFRNVQKDTLHKVNKEECNNLIERWQSEDCMKALTAFFSKQSKL